MRKTLWLFVYLLLLLFVCVFMCGHNNSEFNLGWYPQECHPLYFVFFNLLILLFLRL